MSHFLKNIKQIINRLSTQYFVANIIAFTISCLFVTAGIAINLHRFWQYELGYYDFGIFDRPLWLLSQFKAPIIDHFLVPGRINLADHFNPSIYMFTPVYWLTDRSEVLLVIPSIFVALSALLLFQLAKQTSKNIFIALSVLLSYLLFIGTQNAIYSDFHEITVATFFITLVYWAIAKDNKKLYVVALLITLGFKESLALFGIGTAIFVYFHKPAWRKLAIATFIGSIVWLILAIKVVIPAFSGGKYNYGEDRLSDLRSLFISLFSPIVKLQTVMWTFASFIFLPVMQFPLLPTLVLHYAARFTSEASSRWGLGLHYNAEIAPSLAMGAILSLTAIQKRFGKFVAIGVSCILLITSLFLHRFVLHGPLGLAVNPAFYSHTNTFTFLDRMLEVIPVDATVAAQNNLASRLLRNQEIWILREDYRIHLPEYIALDMRPGQNPNNHLGINDVNQLFESIKIDQDYKIIYNEGDQYVFQKVSPTASNLD